MVLIMTPNSYLVILICSIVFLLSSSVSSQQNGRSIKDPLSFYKYAVYLREHFPEYYAVNYLKLSAEYNRMFWDRYGVKPMHTRTTNSKQSKRDILPKKAATRNVVSVSNIYGPSINRIPPLSGRAATQPERINNKFSRSLNNIEMPVTKVVSNYPRESPVVEERDTNAQEWNYHCYMLGYNNSCQSDLPEGIELAPNKTDCKKYINFGCEYRSQQLSCGSGVSEVLKNISFECDINDLMSFTCCLSCKGGINTATSAGNCDMHGDSTLPSFAQEFCCEKFLNPKTIESATESIASSEKPMDAVIAMLDERLSNSLVNKKPVDLDNSTESVTSASPTSITSTTATPPAAAAAVDTIPTTTTTTTETPETDATPTQTQKPTTPATETTTTVTEATTTAAETTTTTSTPSTTIITSTQTSTTPSTTISTTTEPSSTATEKSTTPLTETPSISDSTPISSTSIPTAPTTESKPLIIATRDIDQPEGYKPLENDLYQKIDAKDRSKADYLVILQKTLKIENDGNYENFKLMNLTLRSNIKCDWRFNFEEAVSENNDETLNESNFIEKHEGSSFILLLGGKVEPQTVQYSVECNIKKYKYYKYQVYLNFNNP